MAALIPPKPTHAADVRLQELNRHTPAQSWQVAAHEVEQHRLCDVVCIVPCMQQPACCIGPHHSWACQGALSPTK